VCCSVLQFFKRELQCIAVYCSVLQRVAVIVTVRRHFDCLPLDRNMCSGSSFVVVFCTKTSTSASSVAVCCSVLQCVAVCCSVLQCVAVRPLIGCRVLYEDVDVSFACRSVLQCVEASCSGLQ